MADILMRNLRIELDDYLNAAARARFEYGRNDCFLFVANWILRMTGRDCTAGFRGTYHDAAGAQRIVGGGECDAEAFAIERLAGIGLIPTVAPQTGDVGIVLAPIARSKGRTLMTIVGAIRTGDLWAVKTTESSITHAALDTRRAWELPRS